jgi:YggT family protein
MAVGQALLKTIVLGIFWVLRAIEFFVVVWVILTWVIFFTSRSSFRWKRRRAFETMVQINVFLEAAMRPVLRPFRKLLPPWKTGGVDFSPLLLLLAIFMVRTFLQQLFFAF